MLRTQSRKGLESKESAETSRGLSQASRTRCFTQTPGEERGRKEGEEHGLLPLLGDHQKALDVKSRLLRCKEGNKCR